MAENYAMVTTGDPEEDERQMNAFLLRTWRLSQNTCPNGCGQMVWDDPHNRHCPACQFVGFSTVPYDMVGGNA